MLLSLCLCFGGSLNGSLMAASPVMGIPRFANSKALTATSPSMTTGRPVMA